MAGVATTTKAKAKEMVFDPQGIEEVKARGASAKVPADGRTVIVGDIHGCFREFLELLDAVGFRWDTDLLVHVGDLVAKGPSSEQVLEFCLKHRVLGVQGNHELAVLRRVRKLRKGVPWEEVNDGGDHARLARTLPASLVHYIEVLPHYLHLRNAHHDGRDVLVVHAGVLPDVDVSEQGPQTLAVMRNILPDGRASADTTTGMPWYSGWKGPETVVYGHDSVRGLVQRHNTVGLDSGCVYGGAMSALVLPEGRVVQVPAQRVYTTRIKKPPGRTTPPHSGATEADACGEAKASQQEAAGPATVAAPDSAPEDAATHLVLRTQDAPLTIDEVHATSPA